MIKSRAIGTVEVLLAMSLFMLYSTFVMGALLFSLNSTKTPNARREALSYAEEGLEVARYLRGNDYSSFADGTYGIEFQSGNWNLISGTDIPEVGFTRSLTVSTVSATIKKIESSIDWDNGIDTGTESLVTFLTNWHDPVQPVNTSWAHPGLFASYDLGGTYDPYRMRVYQGYLNMVTVKGNTAYVQNVDYSDLLNPLSLAIESTGVKAADVIFLGDKIHIVSSSNTEFNSMQITSSTNIQSYGDYNLTGNADATGVSSAGNTIYLTRRSNNEAELYQVSDNGNGTFSVGDTFNFSRDMNYLAINGQYAYISSQSWNDEDLKIVDLNSMTVVGGVDVKTWGAEFRIAIANGNLYVFPEETSGIRVYRLSNPTNPTLLSTINIGGEPTDFDFSLSQNLMFVSVNGWAEELQIYDISNPSAITLLGAYDANVPIDTLTYDASRDLIVAGSSNDNSELLFITPSAPSWGNPEVYASYNTPDNYNPRRMRIYNGYLNIVNMKNSKARIYNIDYSDTSNPSVLANADTDAVYKDSVFVGGKTYIAGADNGKELVVTNITSGNNVSVYGTLDLERNNNALGIDYSGGKIYVTRADNRRSQELYKISDNGDGTFSIDSSMDFDRDMSYIKVNGQYAYISSQSWDDDDLIVVDTNTMTRVGSTDVQTWGAQFRMDIIKNHLFVFPEEGSGVRVYSLNNPTAPLLENVIDVSGTVEDFYYNSSNDMLYLAIDGWDRDISLYDMSNVAYPSLVGTLDQSGSIDTIVYDPTRDLIIAGSPGNSKEILFIVAGY